ncbi:cation diffusion facilitator family transporter [Nemorincola caseinilytica]|uniref:Cation diffusion facilitator family transporter n=1 Tax=Nemorincola caseinilytica TaxID=2054315 RepID=A0ABP8NJP3_9BACT
MPVRIQRYIAILSVVLFAAKMLAWWLTHSVTVLTDALEGIVNMVAGFLGLYSVVLAARPRDTDHPYGHGKVEFISAGIEGTLIIIAGGVIVYEGVHNLFIPHTLQHLNIGLAIVSAAGLINYLAGSYAVKQGQKLNSMVITSAGAHLLTDAYSTIAVIVGVSIILLTNNQWPWLDAVVALFFAIITIRTGYKVLRRSISGMMDEMDLGTLKKVIEVLQQHRHPEWIDLHNLRVIQYGSLMHIDAHLTLPWYHKVADADKEIHELEALMRSHLSDQVELFIHIDGCMPYQCKLCAVPDCPVRQEPLQAQLQWDINNVWTDAKHGKGS